MRVAIASRIFAPEPAAASLRLAALAEALVDQGAEVSVLTVVSPRQDPDDATRQYRIHRFPVLRDRNGYVRGYLQYLSFDVPLFFRILFGRRQSVYVVEPPPTTGFAVRVALAIRRAPYVYYAADLWSDAAEATDVPGLVLRGVRSVERAAIEGAARVLTVNDRMGERAAQIAPRARLVVVGNGADTHAFSAHGDAVDEGRYLIYAGTASEWQGAGIFIAAFAQIAREVPDLRLVFIGQGSDWDSLRQQASEIAEPERVLFLDSLPPAEAARWMRGAVASVASLRPDAGYSVAFPTKIYASWACGTPVVFAGEGQVNDFIRDNAAHAALGVACRYDVDEVAEAFRHAVSRSRTGAERHGLGAWASSNVSLQSVARKAADAVIAVGEGKTD